MTPTIHLQTKPEIALKKQKKIGINDFPFTLNTTIGCLFGCRYCYLQNAPYKWKTVFGKEVKVKLWLPNKLDREMDSRKNLQQHLKRVQINLATEGYLPQVMHKVQNQLGRDIMAETLEVFRKHWLNGNKWMLHLVTKSHMIKKHLPIISSMKDQIQLELTITTLNESRARILEGYASSVQKRLDIIKEFAAAGVFVRVMCMPFIGNKADAQIVRDKCFNLGAKAFKHKAMNYWDESEILKGNLVAKGGKKDTIFEDIYVKSGEPVLDSDGNTSSVSVSMPDKLWQNYSNTSMVIVDSGYADCNNVNWSHVK